MIEIKCKDCGRFLGTTETSVTITLKCSNSSCKSLQEYKITLMSELLKEKDHAH